jgi:hypothetical protein
LGALLHASTTADSIDMGYLRGLAALALLKSMYGMAFFASWFAHQLDRDDYARWLMQGPGLSYPVALLAAISACLLHIVAFALLRASAPDKVDRIERWCVSVSVVACLTFTILLVRL